MKNLYQNLPETPGVYLMKNAGGIILYIGKAANLKRRVSSYFTRPHDGRLEKLASAIRKIDYRPTETALEALILESALIKKYQPLFNIREKDDKSFLFVEITKEEFPRVLLARGKSRAVGRRFGPFTSASNIREGLRIVRRIFPFSTHSAETLGKFKRPCFDYELGLCPGTCVGIIDRQDYLRNIKNIVFLFQGRKRMILKNLEKEMKIASRKMEFEKAEKTRRQIFALRHIQDIALIAGENLQFSNSSFQKQWRIEGYDISNISGTAAVGSMVVFLNNRPDRNQYRKFKIGTVFGSNDTAMLQEVLSRRLRHREWPLPDLFLIDGGKPQVNAVRQVLDDSGLVLPVVGIAKGAKRKKNEFIGAIPEGIEEKILIRVRNEAHRFAISYHKKLRSNRSLL